MGEVATSDLVPFDGDPRERRGYVALLPLVATFDLSPLMGIPENGCVAGMREPLLIFPRVM